MFKSFAAALLSAAALARGTADGSSPDNAYVTTLIDEADLGIKLTLYTYNSQALGDTRAEDTYEFHGDTHLETTKPITSAVRFGWCIEAKKEVLAADMIPAKPAVEAVEAVAEVKDGDGNVTTEAVEAVEAVAAVAEIPAVAQADPIWDCQVITTNLDSTDVDTSTIQLDESDWYKNFQIDDYNFQGKSSALTGIGELKADALVDVKDADKNWLLSGAKSYKKCAKADTAKFDQEQGTENAKLKNFFPTDGANKQAVYVDCAKSETQTGHSANGADNRFGVNAHWFRDFETDQPEQDMQLSLEDDADATRRVFGFFIQYGRSQANEPADRTYKTAKATEVLFDEDVGEITTIKPISAVWKAEREKLIKDEADAAAKKAKEEEEAAKANENKEEDSDDEDETPSTDEGKKDKDGAAQIAATTTAFIVAVSALAF